MMEELSALDKRVAAMENNHIAIQKDITALTRDVASLTTNVKTITDSLKSIATASQVNARTNWGVIASWAGVVVVLVGLVVYEPLRNLAHGHSEHVRDGHPVSVIDKIDAITGRVVIIENWKDTNADSDARTEERLLNIEREVFSGTSYRSGRPHGGINQ